MDKVGPTVSLGAESTMGLKLEELKSVAKISVVVIFFSF